MNHRQFVGPGRFRRLAFRVRGPEQRLTSQLAGRTSLARPRCQGTLGRGRMTQPGLRRGPRERAIIALWST